MTQTLQGQPIWMPAYANAGLNPTLPPLSAPNLAAFAVQQCARYADQLAFSVVLPNGMKAQLTYQAVNDLSDRFAAYLRQTLGLSAGERVAVQMPNSLPYPVVALGVIKAGCVLVNTNPLYTASEMIHQFNDSGAKVLVVVDLFADKLPEVLAKTQIKHVITTEVTAFFGTVPRLIVRTVQRYVKKMLPDITVAHTPFKDTLRGGDVAQVKSYWQHLGPDDMVALQYTGGTTGVSKGAVLTHGNLLHNINQMLAMVSTHTELGKECILTALPLYHIFAFTVNLLGFMGLGAHNVLIPSPRPIGNLQKAFETFPVTWLTGVNTLFNALLNEPWFAQNPPKTLKAAASGGTALHHAVAQRWRDVVKAPIAEGYGLTESSPVVSFNALTGKSRDGSIGFPVPGTEVKMMDDAMQEVALGQPGELWVKGPQVMRGYWNNPAETDKVLHDGWLATGDIAVMDETGYIAIVDRKKDMILVSGFNVYPNAVEDVVADMPCVAEVAVIGVPDAQTGEAVKAFVVLHPNHASEFSKEALLAHCREKLTSYKVPKQVEVRTELPKTPIGKVLRKNLRQT